MFDAVFNRFYEKNKAIKVIGVWGKDGLVLEKKCFQDTVAREAKLDVDVEFSGAELADIISKLDKTRISAGTYFLKLEFRGHLLMIFSLTGDYFLMIVAGGDIIEGKLKFYLSLYKDQLVALL